MNTQMEKFLSLENFKLAYIRLKTAQRSEYKEFYYQDFKAFEAFFDNNINQLLHEVKENIYTPSTCEKYYIPKKKNLARPITLLNLLDQIVYQAIANVVADEMHPIMSRYFNINTFGNMFIHTKSENNIFFYEKWKIQWKRFNRNKKDAFSKGYVYSADFDIASFYDTIDHGILLSLLRKYGIDANLVSLLERCMASWTVSPTSKVEFQKSSGIPQGPISSALFAEIYLFSIDEEMRKQKSIQYTRYADDISIMASSEQDCRRMIVYLDLLARDLSLIPQSEKIEVSYIEDINKHINNVSARFSTIAKEYKKNDNSLSIRTHNKLKKQFLDTINSGEFNKTIIRFALFKLNKDDNIKKAIIENIKQLELYYDGIIYYFNRHFPSDSDFADHISAYLLGDTVLFQYNKALLFKNDMYLPFSERIFRNNFKDTQRFWIVQYQLLSWLKRNDRVALAVECYTGENYYIKRKINYLKLMSISDDELKRLFFERLIADASPMLSIHGLYLWSTHSWNLQIESEGNNGYSKRILEGNNQDYFTYTMNATYGISVPQRFLNSISSNIDIYNEAKNNLRDYISYREINPGLSLMCLDLLHNIFFDVLAEDKKYSIGDLGASLPQMQDDFPLAFSAFSKVHDMRNQRTFAHYKNKGGQPRMRISVTEYNRLLSDVRLNEAYAEFFEQFS